MVACWMYGETVHKRWTFEVLKWYQKIVKGNNEDKVGG